MHNHSAEFVCGASVHAYILLHNFFGPPVLLTIPTGSLIGSAIFFRADATFSLYVTLCHPIPPPNLFIPGGYGPNVIHRSLGPPEPIP